MEQAIGSNVGYAEAVRRRFPLAVFIGAAMLALTLVLALGLPSYYKSKAVVLIEAQEIPQDLVRSLVTSFADQRMQMIAQRVLTNANLAGIITKYDLYRDARERQPMESVLEEMREDISLVPISADVVDPRQGKAVQATIAFEIAYTNRSPDMAQRVANEIVSLFLNENLKQRTETSEETLGFLTAESEKLRADVAELEQKLATFKEGNVERLPELTTLNLEMMNRTETQITQLESQIQSLAQQRVYLESELAQQKPVTLLISETGQRILGPSDRLKVLESEFIPLAARYGANHPDVIAKKKEIESLRAQVGGTNAEIELGLKLQKSQAELSMARQKYSADHPDVKRLNREVLELRKQLDSARTSTPVSVSSNSPPDNPAYIQLQARLEATNNDISSLERQRSSLREKLADLEQRITQSPEVEREYRMLTRDYENAHSKYQEVLAKKQEAELASNLESKQRGERFTLIEPPVIPEEPAKPNRLAIALLGAFLSVAGSIGGGALAETLDSRIYGRAGITRLLGVPPLAVIPKINTVKSRSQTKRRILLALAGSMIVATAALTLIHFTYSPLDVLFFRIMRFLGI